MANRHSWAQRWPEWANLQENRETNGFAQLDFHAVSFLNRNHNKAECQ
jgi:hypothetical protein